MIFQDAAASFNPEFSVEWILEEPLVIQKAGSKKERERQVKKMLRLVRMEKIDVRKTTAALSGGERQRVAIARAILKDSPIILLDEALSSLDAENAVAIQKGIEEMIKGKTVFLVSHTLSYIQNSDQILVLSDGILQGCGKHEELLQTVPLYQTMWEKEKSIKNWKLA